MASAGTLLAFAVPGDQIKSQADQIAQLRSDAVSLSAEPTYIEDGGEPSTDTSGHHLESARAVVVVPTVEEWNAKASRRFNVLATKEAYETITVAEMRELEALDALRERQLAPMSIEEMFRASEARRQTDTLIEALKSYVAFYDPRKRPPHHAARKAKV